MVNLLRLKEAEAMFLTRYPGGFTHNPELLEIIEKKHHKDKLFHFAEAEFSPAQFKDKGGITDSMVKLVSRSTVISLFEKPKFRDGVKALTPAGKDSLASSLEAWLYQPSQSSFEAWSDNLRKLDSAKWPLVTLFAVMLRPTQDVLIKPSTVKLIIEKLELPLSYSPKPSYEFYKAYQQSLLDLQGFVDVSLTSNTLAFGGFLMMSL